MSSNRLSVVDGDITGLAVDAIVNAANERLAPGGGVCGAIHRIAGPALARECAAIGFCPTGEARLTKGYGLPARFVIHAVGPVWHGGGQGEDKLLASCYGAALDLAVANAVRTIAFPAISTGIYGYPLEPATRIAVGTVAGVLAREPKLEQVIFCTFGLEATAAYERALEALAR
ncbi:MAG: O-acetyl-ADP-ribose deacetylase [Proteobacteria bacterium]|nr:O-acetyl-ADP-ribose deacetylase [Pseudomonadota bacterium]MBI3499713.1 O-acetyl-ADP-ribose deacetylase [Pseudomonadota bacterium]